MGLNKRRTHYLCLLMILHLLFVLMSFGNNAQCSSSLRLAFAFSSSSFAFFFCKLFFFLFNTNSLDLAFLSSFVISLMSSFSFFFLGCQSGSESVSPSTSFFSVSLVSAFLFFLFSFFFFSWMTQGLAQDQVLSLPCSPCPLPALLQLSPSLLSPLPQQWGTYVWLF